MRPLRLEKDSTRRSDLAGGCSSLNTSGPLYSSSETITWVRTLPISVLIFALFIIGYLGSSLLLQQELLL